MHNINWELFLTIIINEFLTTSNIQGTDNFEDSDTFFLNTFSTTIQELKFFLLNKFYDPAVVAWW